MTTPHSHGGQRVLARVALERPGISGDTGRELVHLPELPFGAPHRWIQEDADIRVVGRRERQAAPWEAEPHSCLELVSYAFSPRWRDLARETNPASMRESFARHVDAALRPLLEQLPLGAALVAEHEFRPLGDGGARLVSRLRLEQAGELHDTLQTELIVCLSTLSDNYGFRRSDVEPEADVGFGDTFLIRPLTVPCLPRGCAMGFTAGAAGAGAGVRLPIPLGASVGNSSPTFPVGPGGLDQTLTAARAAAQTLRFRIRLVRERLPAAFADTMARLLRDDLTEGSPDEPGVGRIGGVTLYRLLSDWVNTHGDVLRIELEAAGDIGKKPSASLLRILAAEVFPGRQVEIVATEQAVQPAGQLDLGAMLPIAERLPPLLPMPTALESLAFPGHFSNPAVSLPGQGILLGHAQLAGLEHPVRITEADRSRHVYVLGATGTGKSTLLLNMIRQDMEAGHGIALIDPHGDLFQQVLASVPSRRADDVLLIDPSDDSRPVSLNPLDFGDDPDIMKVNRLINDLLDIFGELWNMREAGGPVFELCFRSLLLLASSAPEDTPPGACCEGPPTLLTAVEIMRDRDYRNYLLERCEASYLGSEFGTEVRRFFKSAHDTSGEQSFENFVLYITSKLTRFTSNPRLRRILCTPRRTVDFRQAMDQGRIILVNLNKGRLGDQDTRMLGMLITKYLFQAALSRSDIPHGARRPFHYYLDEFQNFVTQDIPDVLSEARKFGLHLTLAHQTLGQLRDRGQSALLDTILGNVATRLYFRVGMQEARHLEAEFLPHFDAHALARLPDRHVLARLLTHDKPSPPFVFKTLHCDAKYGKDVPSDSNQHTEQEAQC